MPFRYRIAALGLALSLAILGPSVALADEYKDAVNEVKAVLGALNEDPDNNIVGVFNQKDQEIKTRSSIDVDVIAGPEVVPGNVAWAQSSCVECESWAVSLQIALYTPGATNVSPENLATALNIACTNCVTVARARQIVKPVDDPERIARDAAYALEPIRARLHTVLHDIKKDSLTTEQALAEIGLILADFSALGDQIEAGTLPPAPSGYVEGGDD